MAIFSDLVEDVMEFFMNVFFGIQDFIYSLYPQFEHCARKMSS